jgi:hypothetical protein
MTERNPRTAQPPHKINYENSRRNFGYVGHPLVKCDTAFEFAQCAVKGSLSFWDPPVYVWSQFVIAFTNRNIFYFLFLCRRIPTSQSTILQILKQFKLVNLYLQGFKDWSCGHWCTYLSSCHLNLSNGACINCAQRKTALQKTHPILLELLHICT